MEHSTFNVLHHDEGGPDYIAVLAEQEHPAHGHVGLRQGLHDAILALDRVRRRQQLAGRLLAQDIPTRANLEQESRV